MVKVRIWDLPTRAFHWALAAAVIGLVVTGKVGGNAMVWHFWLGYATLTLLLFRLVWGLIGGHWSRFARFIYSPASLFAYLKGEQRPEWTTGHSPTGALSVFALLALLLVQAGTGLFADDEIAFSGPLSVAASGDTVSAATRWHTGWGQWLLIGLVVLHVAAIVYYRVVKRQNLLTPMLSGDKTLAGAPVTPTRDSLGTRVLALVVAALAGGFVYWLVNFGPKALAA